MSHPNDKLGGIKEMVQFNKNSHGHPEMTIKIKDVQWLIEQAERVKRLQEENMRLLNELEKTGVYQNCVACSNLINTESESYIVGESIGEYWCQKCTDNERKRLEKSTKYVDEIETSGWIINVGDVFSNGYNEYHLKVTKIFLPQDCDPDDATIYCVLVDPNDHSKVIEGTEDNHRAWYINESWFK